jgi:hypothetical protein
MKMTITYNIPEERFSSSLWTVPLWIGLGKIGSALFVPGVNIYSDKNKFAKLALLAHGRGIVAELSINKDMKAFQGYEFRIFPDSPKGLWMLCLQKVLSQAPLALPASLVQVEIS